MRVSENWRLKKQRYTLAGKMNEETGKVTFPPRSIEPCKVETFDFSKEAEAYEWTTEVKAYNKVGA